MSKVKHIKLMEGDSYQLSDNEIDAFKKFITLNSELPAKIIGKKLIFDNYIIGGITVGSTSITILPRIKEMTANDYFEMQLYCSGVPVSNLSSVVGEDIGYGMQDALIDMFLSQCQKLISKGIEGQFISERKKSNLIKGKILVDELNPVDLSNGLVPIEYNIHSLQTPENKIIKLALNKCLPLVKFDRLDKVTLINSYFSEISVLSTEYKKLLFDIKHSNIFHSNPEYAVTLELACKIMDELRINMKNTSVLGSAYLINSNNLFESYARRVLHDNLIMNVDKWKKPKPMAKYVINNISYEKSYIPDILINYQESKMTAYAVLDAKNKDISEPEDMAKLQDLYQVTFYCTSLNTNYGALVYPCKKRVKPTLVNIEAFPSLQFYVLGIDFSQPIYARNQMYVEDVKSCFGIN